MYPDSCGFSLPLKTHHGSVITPVPYGNASDVCGPSFKHMLLSVCLDIATVVRKKKIVFLITQKTAVQTLKALVEVVACRSKSYSNISNHTFEIKLTLKKKVKPCLRICHTSRLT